MNSRNKKMIIVCSIAVIVAIPAVFYLPSYIKYGPCDGSCYSIEKSFTFNRGGYPRMAQIDDLLLVAYSNGSFVLDGVNLSSGTKCTSRVIINGGVDPARCTLFYSSDLELLICVFNHDNAASCGIAWANKNEIFDPNAWQIQLNIVGPVYQEFGDIGLWEPYLSSYNSTSMLLYFSNQTIYDPDDPIDSELYGMALIIYRVGRFTIRMEWHPL
ncbi:MAG: hypothetical protein GF364_15695 [Candidatus Lokiarchaeota archaeon]|nr:hypothetical protein [Candidatus Lokiarchaeota archaeon]